MPRQYKRQEGARKYGFATDLMQHALADVQNNHMSVKKAAFLHGINRTTLMNHLKQRHCGPVGRPTLLAPSEERLIVHALQKLGDWGLGIDRSAVQCIVLDYLKNVGRLDVKPGIEWLYGFERRWKCELTRRVAQPLPANRAYACNSRVVNDFFDKLSEIFSRLNLQAKPQNIFNVDETGFQTDIGSQKIFCKRGLKNPHKTVSSSTKTMYTVQVCCSANGDFLPMYIVFKGKHLYDTWCKGGPEDAVYNCSDSGWMESDQFIEWFQKVFLPATSHLEGGKLLVFDGHNSHLSTKVVDIAVQNNTELLCLPAHTSSILQPLDVGVFKGVKAAWRKCLCDYYDQTRYCNVDKRAFPSLLKQVIESGAFSRANAVSAFEACGIYPLNRAKITADKLATSTPLVTEMTAGSDTVQASTQAVSSTATVISPRKGIEAALLTHFRQVTPTTTGQKNKRVKRTLAECLTSQEVIERMRDREGTSHDSNMKPKQKPKQKPKRRCHTGKRKCGSGVSELHIRKPVWLVSNQGKATAVDQPNKSVEPSTSDTHMTTAQDVLPDLTLSSEATATSEGFFVICWLLKKHIVSHCSER